MPLNQIPTKHRTDSDCTVDPDTELCTTCGVDHSGDPCERCCGVAFHVGDCNRPVPAAQRSAWKTAMQA